MLFLDFYNLDPSENAPTPPPKKNKQTNKNKTKQKSLLLPLPGWSLWSKIVKGSQDKVVHKERVIIYSATF